jgi:ADP-ribose pyrophosphatase YjhB (NUDIX family)
MSEDKPYRPNVGIALFNMSGRVLIGRRFRDDGPETILPGLEWQMPQGGVDAGEDLQAAVLRELWEETGVRNAEILGETDWLTYEFPALRRTATSPLKISGSAAEMVRAAIYRRRCRDRSAHRAQQPAGRVRCLAMGRFGPGRRSRSAVPPRGLSQRGEEFCEICKVANSGRP